MLLLWLVGGLVAVYAQVTVLYNNNALQYSANWDPDNEFGGCSPPGYKANSHLGASVQLVFSGMSLLGSTCIHN